MARLDPWATPMTWQDWAANLCYLLLAASYLVADLYWLRILAIVALGLEGIYFYFGSTPPLWVGIGWSAVFVAINLVQLMRMTRERLAVNLSERESFVHRAMFPELTAVQFNRFLKIGHWREVSDGTVLAEKGQPVPELLLIASGTVKVMVGAEVVALQQPGSFVGEMSYISGEAASATVNAVGKVVLLSVPRSALDQLFAQDMDVKAALMRVIGYALTEKLRARHASLPRPASAAP
jgi:CRP-like cAMP-binding protein